MSHKQVHGWDLVDGLALPRGRASRERIALSAGRLLTDISGAHTPGTRPDLWAGFPLMQAAGLKPPQPKASCKIPKGGKDTGASLLNRRSFLKAVPLSGIRVHSASLPLTCGRLPSTPNFRNLCEMGEIQVFLPWAE